MKFAFNAIASVTFVFSLAANATDLGFRFNGTACVDKTGKAGLNPSFFGQCGDLRHLTIAGLALDGVDLSGAVFDGSDFQGSTFVGSILTYASFVGTNLSGVSLINATVHHTNFTSANLRNAKLAGADIQMANFSKVDLSGETLSTMTFTGSLFGGANFSGAALDSTDFTGCDLTRVNFTKANLQSSTLAGTTLDAAVFVNADLTKANLKKALGSGPVFTAAILRQSVLDGVSITGGMLRGAQMDSASIQNANFEASDMRHASLANTNISGSTFKAVRINKATVLPIPMDQALKLGMLLDTSVNLLLLYDPQDPDVAQLVAALQGQGIQVTVSPEDFTKFAGDVDLSDYSSIVQLGGNGYNSDMPMAGQTSLVSFVQAGGIYINTGGTFYDQGNFNTFAGMADLMLLKFTQQTEMPSLQLTAASGMSSHPVLNGITSLTMTNMYYVQSAVKTFSANPPTVLMTDAAAEPMIVVRDFGSGHVVNFGFCAAGNTACLEDAGVQRLLANAASWQ